MRHHKAYETDDSGDGNQRSHDNGADHKHPAPEIFHIHTHGGGVLVSHHHEVEGAAFPGEADTARQHAHRGNPQGIPLSRRQASHLPVIYGRNALRTLGQKDEKARDGAHHCIDCRSGKKQRHGLNFSAASDLRHAVNAGKGHQSAAESHSRGLILSPEKRNRHQQRPGCSCRCSGGNSQNIRFCDGVQYQRLHGSSTNRKAGAAADTKEHSWQTDVPYDLIKRFLPQTRLCSFSLEKELVNQNPVNGAHIDGRGAHRYDSNHGKEETQ